MKNWIILILALPLITFSCRKDIDNVTITNSNYAPPTVLVTADLSGQVVGPNGEVIEGAMVRIGSEVEITNEAGLYQFTDLQMNAKGTYVRVTKAGYFNGSDRFYPGNGSRNVNRIELLPKTLAGEVDAAAGGTVNVEGAKIALPANGVVDPQGQAYSGNIEVYAQWLNPADENLGDFMPGGLFGVNTAGQEVTMTSMGMLAVELFDESGTPLQIAPGQEAQLTYPIPTELRSIAPDEIPLWYFDDTDGVWIEEGKAILDGDVYVGNVSHFTFWNVDFPYGTETVDISGCVKFPDGSVAAYEGFTVAVDGQGTIIWGTTDDAGNFYGPVPTGEVLNFYFASDCGGNQVFTAGPFTEDTELTGCFTLEVSEAATLSGQVVDCDGNPVDGAIVTLSENPWTSLIVVTDESGNFSQTYNGCSDYDIDLVAYDLANLETSEVLNYSFSEDLNLGTIAACGVTLENYLSSDADGVLQDFYDVTLGIDTILYTPDSINFETYSIISATGFGPAGNQESISLWLNNLAVGSYTGIDVGYQYNSTLDQPVDGGFSLYCYPPCGTVTINITANGGSGGFLEGNYSGTSDGWTSQQLPLTDRPVSGTFTIRIP